MSRIRTLLGRFKRPLSQRYPVLSPLGFLRLTLIPGWLPLAAVVATQLPLPRQKKIYKTFFPLVFLSLTLASLAWLQPVPITQARTLAQTDGLTLEIIGPATVAVGDTFEIQVLADNPSAAGIFGYQFGLTWNSAAVVPVEATPRLSPDFPLIAENAMAEGQLNVAASRQGDVPELVGSVTLLTWTFQAIASTPGEAAHFDLISVTLGQKDGLALPLAGVTSLNLAIDQPLPQQGSLSGQIQGEGRVPGNQAGFTILVNELGLAVATTPTGDFSFAGLEFGTYTLTASSPGFLSATCSNVTLNSEATTLAGVTLLAGDLTGDGLIDVADATALGLTIGSGGPGSVADLNVDGQVNVLDLILLAVNFGQSGAAQPWICQP